LPLTMLSISDVDSTGMRRNCKYGRRRGCSSYFSCFSYGSYFSYSS